MSRYRPPQPRSSLYITAAGYQRLQNELQGLWQRRSEVVKALSAAAEGDRSENAEYIYRKKELREIDRRIRYLQRRLPELNVVSAAPSDPSRVYFGAWVSVEDEAGTEHTFRVVGPDEFDAEQGWISMDAPLARALMKKQVDDEVVIDLPKGKTRYWITGIRYAP